jgi:transglutaminase-like putative cysteine protease
MARKPSVNPAEAARKQSHVSVERYFEISLLLMLGISFLTLANTGKLDPVSVVTVSGSLLIKLWSYVRDTDYSLSPRTVTRLAVFYIFFYWLDFLIFSLGPTILDRLLAATVHLILFATVIKVFSARTYRDYGYLATLSFMMMLASAILTVGAAFLVGFTLYVLFAISTLISYEIKRATETSYRPPEGPFAQPLQNRIALEKSLMTTTVGLAVGIVILASVLFFVIPRYRTGYLTAVGMQGQSITGFSDTVNLGDIRKILRSNLVVMRIIPEGNPRALQGIKWRGIGLTSFDGHHWYNDNTEQTVLLPASVRPPEERRFVLPQVVGGENRPRHPLRYRVLLSSISTDVLFAAAVPRELSGRLRVVNVDQADSLRNPGHTPSPFVYAVVSETGLPSPEQLQRAPTEYPAQVRIPYLRLPRADPRIEDLAQQVTISARNNYDRALMIQNYLRDNFAYSLDPPSIDPADPIGSFLLTAKKGYCEYFAAAMALMLRTLRVPTRVVNGFQTGTYNRFGKDFVVRARDAHSWVEVYFPQYGWIPFDPTPADPNPVPAGVFDDYIDAMGLFWSEWIINYDFAHRAQLAQSVEQESRQLQQKLKQRVDRFQKQVIRLAYRAEGWLMAHKVLLFLFMLAVLAALIGAEKIASLAELRFLWAWRFRRRDLSLSPREATMTYQRFLKVLRKKRIKKSPAQTPQEFASTFLGSPLAGLVAEFTRLYNALRFGGLPVSLVRLRELVEQIRRTRTIRG